MIGRTLGNYRIVEQIGLGGMATVFKGYDPDTDRYVAVKILPQHFSHDPQFRERFKREAKAIAKLEHLHILPIFSYGEEDGIAYMAMRYLQGGTLTERIAQGPLPFNEAEQILRQLASALDHAHSQNILHRDMKPSNVLLDKAGNAYLMDFGIAKIVEATVDLTGDRLLGTPAYMSPEQCKGEPIGPASDIYSLGIILYEMVTGRRPFHAETPIAVILQQLNDPLPPPRQSRPDLPEKAENVIFKALAKSPESRYKTATDLADAFSRAIATADTAVSPTRPVPPPAPAPVPEEMTSETAASTLLSPGVPPPTKQPLPAWAWGLIGLLAAAALITLGMFLASRGGPGRPPQVADAGAATAVPRDEPAAPRNDNPEPAGQALSQPLPPVPKCLAGQTELFFDDFEDGNFNGWDLSDANGQPSTGGWHVIRQDDNYVLVGQGHSWANAPATFGQDYVLHLRVRPATTEANWHTNVRMGGDGRYFIAVDSLNRDPDEKKLITWPYHPDDRWHILSIIAKQNHLEIAWDGSQKAAVDDRNPIKAGIVALENLSGTVWYDDIRVCALPPAGEEAEALPEKPGRNAREHLMSLLKEQALELTGAPSWSPDGSQIAFSALKPGADVNRDNRLYVINADGSELRELPPVGNSISPAWSPDGKWLAFHNNCDLTLLAPDGSGERTIWRAGENDSCVHKPQWSPDSQQIVFVASPNREQRPPYNRQIYLATLSGESELVDTAVITTDTCPWNDVAFSPNGQDAALFDADCQPIRLNLASGDVKPLAEFPAGWLASSHPQWVDGREMD